jgi:sulfur carrier protein
MQVVINGETSRLERVRTVADLVRHLRLEGRIAVEINREIVPRSRFAERELRDGDVIEVVNAVGGG